jgi:hypothetical protein
MSGWTIKAIYSSASFETFKAARKVFHQKTRQHFAHATINNFCQLSRARDSKSDRRSSVTIEIFCLHIGG